jgi:hypothetical protein
MVEMFAEWGAACALIRRFTAFPEATRMSTTRPPLNCEAGWI